jgi:hypothetical protein
VNYLNLEGRDSLPIPRNAHCIHRRYARYNFAIIGSLYFEEVVNAEVYQSIIMTSRSFLKFQGRELYSAGWHFPS